MVGPEAEATGLVRHVGHLFVAGAALSVPMVAVITRRGYGLGAQAMCGGSFNTPLLTVAWPQAELGGMGLEGAVRLGFRNELNAIADPTERAAAEAHMIAVAYEHGRALNVAGHLEVDDVIDPSDTRRIVATTLDRSPARLHGGRDRPFVDPI
jgi:acetyl-CoA carboxylase carboxyltransferase component